MLDLDQIETWSADPTARFVGDRARGEMRNQIISVNGRALVTTMQRVCTVVASATLSAMLVLGAASSATASVPLTSRLIPGAVINKDFSHFLNDPTDMFVTSDYQLGCDGQSALFEGRECGGVGV